jgi:hypothetical protein
MNTPSEVGGVLAWIADCLPRTPDVEGYRRLLTRVANHLLPLSGTIIRGTLKAPNSQLVTPISIKLQRPDGFD